MLKKTKKGELFQDANMKYVDIFRSVNRKMLSTFSFNVNILTESVCVCVFFFRT